MSLIYSCIHNTRGVWNKRGGWTNCLKLIEGGVGNTSNKRGGWTKCSKINKRGGWTYMEYKGGGRHPITFTTPFRYTEYPFFRGMVNS